MTGVLNLFSGANIGQTLAGLAQTAARPGFELRFAQLQNTVINRINQKIEEINNDNTGVISPQMVLEKARMQRTSDILNGYQNELTNQYNGVADIYNKLMDLDEGDPEAFDRVLGQINQTASLLQNVDGTPANVFSLDGVADLRDNGVLRVTRDGAQVAVQKFSDFADVNEAKAAISDALSRVSASVNIINTTVDSVDGLRNSVDKRLTAVTLEIEAAKTTASAEKAAKIKEMEQEYARMLNALSLSFEGSQQVTQRIQSLFSEQEIQKGSVMNLFT